MLNVNNYIYTERGILSINDLIHMQENSEDLPKVLTFNTDKTSDDYLKYYFTSVDSIEESTYQNMYEVRFVDVFSSRNVIVNATIDTEILQYNIVQTDDHPIMNKNYQVIRYLKANIHHPKININWVPLSALLNYANKSPNICVGDTVIKFSNKIFRGIENAYYLKKYDDVLPVFAALTKSTHFNFVLVK